MHNVFHLAFAGHQDAGRSCLDYSLKEFPVSSQDDPALIHPYFQDLVVIGVLCIQGIKTKNAELARYAAEHRVGHE
jgi:hypothetical protein